jgi:hypothetical protein
VGDQAGRRPGTLKRLARGAAIALLVLAGGEIAARIATPGGAAAAIRERRAFLARIPGADADAGDRDTDTDALALQASSSGFQLHPFVGYTAIPGENGANNQGFFAGGAIYPYKKSAGEFVIALFGGSVAAQLYGVKDTILERLSPALRAKGFERVRLISFALAGWRQPQSFVAFALYLQSFDMAVMLDGFNEVIHTDDDELAYYPASFPFAGVWGPLAHHAGSPEKILRASELIRNNRSMASLTREIDRSPLRSSMLVHLAWRVAARRYERRANELRGEAQRDLLDAWRSFDSPAEDSREKRLEYLREYEDLIADAGVLARVSGKSFFHFVQPNQYDRGSKSLSEEEMRDRVPNKTWFDLVTPQYDWLRAMVVRLQARGVSSSDLTGLFAHTSETIYSDGCCHLNERGLEILARAIADRIQTQADLGGVDRSARQGEGKE